MKKVSFSRGVIMTLASMPDVFALHPSSVKSGYVVTVKKSGATTDNAWKSTASQLNSTVERFAKTYDSKRAGSRIAGSSKPKTVRAA
ncbi:hypothetical protein N6G05_26490 [Cupriavidus gilardii]|uniref:hypothetical protein n=1 Tax=Cupriavidus gilardii TaxID=82541 RepID=UPI000A8AAFDD|nr:hypothetical protein [Cupriavidus gilardii]MCT9017103.1 hypothetical protein [Cupriavidus gilardii]MCT9056773.1 hypothetical protein [Cupriavidus gilardii]